MEKTLIVLQGPTAIGKTKLGIQLAKAFETEVISADSRQVFSEMKIGTAKPSVSELGGVPHHLLGHKSINEEYNAESFAKEAFAKLKEIFGGHDIAVLVGGSGFYIQALLKDMDEIPDVPSGIRVELNRLYNEKGIEILQKELEKKDPEYFVKVDQQNPQRLIRALEVIRATGKTFSSFHKAKQRSFPFRVINIALTMDRSDLYKRIEDRVDQMISDGLEEEAKGLYGQRHMNALQTVGYTEFFDYFDGKISKAECIENIKINTRRFAKRQLTWLRRIEDIHWIDVGEQFDIIAFIEEKLR